MIEKILETINDRITHASINQNDAVVKAMKELREFIWGLAGK